MRFIKGSEREESMDVGHLLAILISWYQAPYSLSVSLQNPAAKYLFFGRAHTRLAGLIGDIIQSKEAAKIQPISVDYDVIGMALECAGFSKGLERDDY